MRRPLETRQLDIRKLRERLRNLERQAIQSKSDLTDEQRLNLLVLLDALSIICGRIGCLSGAGSNVWYSIRKLAFEQISSLYSQRQDERKANTYHRLHLLPGHKTCISETCLKLLQVMKLWHYQIQCIKST